MRDLCDRAVREELGIPLRVAARLAGVSRPTLAMWERAPNFVSEAKSEPCVELYKQLRVLLERAPGRRR